MNWDGYFHSICEAVSIKSPCLSRKIGAILVRDKSIVSTGYNGPARGVPHCGHARFISDPALSSAIHEMPDQFSPVEISTTCPRRLLGFGSGHGMQYCPAQHAEENCVSNAARNGTSTIGTVLYMNSVIPCKNCFSTLINAGIVEVVVDAITFYDQFTKYIVEQSNVRIREFNNE